MFTLIRKVIFGLLLCVITLPAMAENTILVLGDSLSSAYGLQPDQGWVALLQKKLKENHYAYRVVNESVTGDTTSNGLVRLPFAMVTNHPVITVIELGGNDGLRGLPLNIVRKNLKAMIAMCKASHAQVLLLGIRLPPNFGPEYTKQFQAMYTELAAENKIAVLPQMLGGIDEDKQMFQSDGVHPVAAAQPTIVSNVWPVLKPMLK